jgi:hypothetical protein
MPKPTGLAVAGAAACAYLAAWRRWGKAGTLWRLGLLAVGATLPLGLVATWVLTSSWRGEIPSLLHEIGAYASGTPWRSLLQIKTWIFFVLPFFPLLIRGVRGGASSATNKLAGCSFRNQLGIA